LLIATETNRSFVVALAEIEDSTGLHMVAALNEDAWKIPGMTLELVQAVVGDGVEVLTGDIAPNIHNPGHAHAEDYIRGYLLKNGGTLKKIGTSWYNHGFCDVCREELGRL
jgi:hypothetical protein